jgi:4-hydroxybenzoate polyprenyltransferase
MTKKIIGLVLGALAGWILSIAIVLSSAFSLRDSNSNSWLNILRNANLIFWVMVAAGALIGLLIASNSTRKSKITVLVTAIVVVVLLFGINLF